MSRKLKKAGYIATIAAIVLAGKSQGPEVQNDSYEQEVKTELVPPQNKITTPTIDVEYTVDTLDTPSSSLAFCSGGKIVRNFVNRKAVYRLRLSVMVHERKHQESARKGLRNLKLSPLGYAAMSMDDEISATIAELIMLRYEYLASNDKKAFLAEHRKGKFGYYFKAVAKRKINPEAKDPISFNKDISFLAKETKKMWMKVYAPIYAPSIKRMVERYVDRMDPNTPIEIQELEYQKAREIAYTIGGIDFRQHLADDIQITDEDLKLLNKVSRISVISGNLKKYYSRIKARLNCLKTAGYEISPEVLTQIFLAEGLKLRLSNIDPNIIKDDPKIVAMCYEQIKEEMMTDKHILSQFYTQENHNDFVFTPKSHLPRELITELYSYKNMDLSQFLPNFNMLNTIYHKPYISLMTFENSIDAFVQTKLNLMRMKSAKNEPAETKNTTPAKPRKSPPQFITLPDLSQPILTDATPEQEEAIYQVIRDFNNIPDVLKGCDLEQQALYFKNQKNK